MLFRSKDPEAIRKVKDLLADLREAWVEISAKKGLEEKTVPATGVNIAG